MIRLKTTVKLFGLGPEMVLACMVVASVFGRKRLDCVVTSARDSVHSVHSKHWIGNAVDFRLRHITSEEIKVEIVKEITDALNMEFDVIWEGKDTSNEHLHVEYDPTMSDAHI